MRQRGRDRRDRRDRDRDRADPIARGELTALARLRRNRPDFDPNEAREEMGVCDYEIRTGAERLSDKVAAIVTFVKDLRREIAHVRRQTDVRSAFEEDLDVFEQQELTRPNKKQRRRA